MTTDGPLPDPADEAAHAAMHARMRAGGRTAVPAWLRETAGEPRWQAMVAVVVMIALQLVEADQGHAAGLAHE